MTFFFRYVINKRKLNNNSTRPIKNKRKLLEPVAARQILQPELSNKEEEEAKAEENEQRVHLKEQELTDPCLVLGLPTCILADILSRLPFESICLCRCVCTAWRSLTHCPVFNLLRLKRTDTEIFLRSDSALYVSRTLNMVDFRRVSCSVPPRDLLEKREFDLEMRVCLPKRVGKDERFDSSLELFDGNVIKKSMKSFEDKRGYTIVNSCNGFLCLRKSSIHSKTPPIICNPFTGEFISIPKPEKEIIRRMGIVSGFGCSSKSNEYKVVRLVYRDSVLNLFDRMTEIYKLGNASWKVVGNAPLDTIQDSSATFLNGAIHWLSVGNVAAEYSILSFDFENEQFRVLPLPSQFLEKLKVKDDPTKSQLSIGVLRDYLFLSGVAYLHYFDVWVMKGYGEQQSWTKEFSLNIFPGIICQPVKWLDNGDLVLLWDRMSLVLLNLNEKRVRKVIIRDAKTIVFEAIAHVPSFGLFKDIVGGDNLVVQNANLRWIESELQELAEAFTLVEEGNGGMEWIFNRW